MPSPSHNAVHQTQRAADKWFLLNITEDTAKRLPDFPLSENAKCYQIECEASTSISYGDHVAALLGPGEWVIGVVETKRPQKAKRISVAVPTDAELVAKGIATRSVAFEIGEVFVIVGYRVSERRSR